MIRLRDVHGLSKTATGRYLKARSAFTDTLVRRRPAWMVSLAFTEANLSEGLRAACASTAMLLLGYLLHNPQFSYAAIGAFWTCLADAAGSKRMRLASMTAFTLLSTLCGGITAYASGAGLLSATPAILVFSSAGALGRIWGAAAAQVSILAATACVVMVDRPIHGNREDLQFLFLYFLGCAFATLLSFTVWRIHPFGASRVALRSTYSRLADIARDSARLLKQDSTDFAKWASHASRFRGQARSALEATRKALGKVPAVKTDRRETYGNLLIAFADCEQIFAYLIAVTDAGERGHHGMPNRRRAARALEAMAETLQRLGKIAADKPGRPSSELHGRLHALAQRLDTALGEKIALRFSTVPGDVETSQEPRKSWWSATYNVLKRAWETLKANASFESIGTRHAVRVGVATTAAFLVVRSLHLPFGYWATMATLLILQPSIATSWPRSIERAAGSIVGGFLAAGLGLLVDSPLGISLCVFPLVCATMALRTVSYSLFVLFITPTFVLVADFASQGGTELAYAATRLGNNVLGCMIALLATFILWPSREPGNFKDRLSAAVTANMAYLGASLAQRRINHTQLERMRRTAGLASNNAEEVLARLRFEQLDTSAADKLGSTALALLRRLAGTATRARFGNSTSPDSASLVAWVHAVAQALNEHLSGNTDVNAPEPFPKQRLSLLEADAVNQVILLRRLLLEHADSLKQRNGEQKRMSG
ncbi:membrane protein-like protein [Caballeronia choica]|uniref:Membrane protein-like protein n=1 Tax=Caballeronia choica TaxID=326476 RepID=A0A158KSX3_9BURK|nr:FUSC family protein [Caballeronia choica]SAL84075.1 membrane protein-like protein [Caballeronia choica]